MTTEARTRGEWTAESPAVVRALRWIRQKGTITAEQLVEWDANHGRKLFTWDNTEAAAFWREQEARVFLNTFRYMFAGKRVRAFINIPGDDATKRERAYHPVEEIAERPDLRAQVIADLKRRMANLAKELRFWDLSRQEQDEVIAAMWAALGRESERT